MQRIIVDPNMAALPQFNKFLSEYARSKGYQTPCDNLPSDILTELIATGLMSFASLHLPVNSVFELVLMDLPPIVCRKLSSYSLEINADSLKDAFDIPDDDPLFEVLANPNNHTVLPPDELFKHPLSEVYTSLNNVELDDPLLNGYAIASLIINSIRHPEDISDGGRKATEMFCQLVLEADPSVPVSSLLERVKAGSLSAMMQASTLIHDAFSQRLQSS